MVFVMEGPSHTRTVLLVDDDASILQLLKATLLREKYNVLLAQGGKAGLEAATQGSPHLVILDLSLPDMEGLEVCRRLRTWYRAPILILSGRSDEEVIVEALDSGADDYLVKPFRPRELTARTRALLRRFSEAPAHQASLRAGDLEVNLASRRAFVSRREIRLTRTEFDVLACLVRNRDCVVTVKMLLDEVWGPWHGNYAQTLRVHIGHIRRKIGWRFSLAQAIQTEPGVGYRFSLPEEPTRARKRTKTMRASR